MMYPGRSTTPPTEPGLEDPVAPMFASTKGLVLVPNVKGFTVQESVLVVELVGLKFRASITIPAFARELGVAGSAAIAACMLRQMSDFPNCDAS